MGFLHVFTFLLTEDFKSIGLFTGRSVSWKKGRAVRLSRLVIKRRKEKGSLSIVFIYLVRIKYLIIELDFITFVI